MEVWWVLGERDLCPSLSMMRDPPALVLLYSRCEPYHVADPLSCLVMPPSLLLLFKFGPLPALPCLLSFSKYAIAFLFCV